MAKRGPKPKPKPKTGRPKLRIRMPTPAISNTDSEQSREEQGRCAHQEFIAYVADSGTPAVRHQGLSYRAARLQLHCRYCSRIAMLSTDAQLAQDSSSIPFTYHYGEPT